MKNAKQRLLGDPRAEILHRGAANPIARQRKEL
jgi:hypothetical protein